MGLPANVNFCNVTGRFIRAVGDGPDEGREPDGVPVSGLSVVFTATLNPPIVRNLAESVSIVIDPITCTTDASGYLLGPDGTPGVMLVASDDTDLDPHGWTWTATVSGGTFPRISTTFVAPVDGSVDLATVVPVPPNPGSQISQWQAVVTTTTTARDEAVAARDEVIDLLENLPTGGDVASVNGQTGTVVLSATDVGALPASYAPAWGDVTGKPASFTPAAHTQAISTITGLDAALAGKANTGDLPSTPAAIGAATAAQGAKADTAVQPAAIANLVPNTRKIAGKALSADVTLTKTEVGLGNADNTSDANKPVSTAQAAAIGAKIGSPNSTITGFAYYPTEADLPTTGSPGVIYLVDGS